MCRLRWYESLFGVQGVRQSAENAPSGVGCGWIGWRSETGEKDWADWLGGFVFEAVERAVQRACVCGRMT
jgi:hypothetical protein